MDIQARLYWRIIRQCLDKDPYFKDFKLADYRFIVANRKTLTPLVWEFGATQRTGLLESKDSRYKLEDPEDIGKVLHKYLKDTPSVPMGIVTEGLNSIEKWLSKDESN